MRYETLENTRKLALPGGEAHRVMTLWLEPDEQVTFTTAAGGEYDFARKDWGFYATPSFRHRLARYGLRPALVAFGAERCLMLVEHGREDDFLSSCETGGGRLVAWLDAADPPLQLLGQDPRAII